MTGHKTNGSWTDVTSIGRNEIVFEGRNKDYGAYYVRQRYNNALLLALLVAVSIGVLGAAIPFVLGLFHKEKPVPKDYTTLNVKLKYVAPVEHLKVIPPPVAPPHPNVNTIRNPPPNIVHTTVIDSINTNTHVNEHTVGTESHTGQGPDSIDLGHHVVNVVEDPNKKPDPVTIVEVMPKFDGDLQKYLMENMIYPPNEKELGVGGVVYLTFIVETDGSISNVKLLRGVSGAPEFDNEAIRVVSGMPNWKPGQQNGHPVRVRFNLPVRFTVN